jgi:hemolysin III
MIESPAQALPNDAVTAPLVKPKLRGVSHQIAAFVAAIATAVLVLTAPSTRAMGVAALYGLSLVAMFTISATYHRPTWQPKARAWMRRLDHAGIFILIAGTYTPIGVYLAPIIGPQMLYVAWIGAILGVFQSLFWVHAPKPVSAALYVALGWACVMFIPAMLREGGWLWVGLLLGGGVIYSLGAVTYALKRPNPNPKVFGYHEIFHVLVIVASICHFIVEVDVIRRLT